MINKDKYYDIIYRFPWQKEKSTIIWLMPDELKYHLKQLKNLAVSLNWELAFWIEKLDYFQIKEKNYTYKNDWGYFEKIEVIDNNTKKPFFIYEQVSEHNIEEKDLTNELLYDFNICWDDYAKMWKLTLEKDYLWVNNYKFKRTKDTKIDDLFDLLFRAKVLYDNLSFTYEELKELLRKKRIKYNELEIIDLYEGGINNIIWKKLRTIQVKTKMKDKILENKGWKISIRQETA